MSTEKKNTATTAMIIAFFPALTSYRDALAFAFLIVILLVKPTGIVGEKIADKV